MITLSLFRHAKSSWSSPACGDFDRPLAPRGREAAPRMGRFMTDNDLVPGLVLCSPAVRARETLELALPELDPTPDVEYEKRLYQAGAEVLLDVIRNAGEEADHVMLVGHNPGLHMLALALMRSGPPDALARLAPKFPTAALAVFGLPGRWRDARAQTAELLHFVVPRELPD